MLIFLLTLLFVLSIAVLLQEKLLNAVILLGVFSLTSSVIYFLVGAPDVAVTEGAIGVAFVNFIYVLALSDQGKLHVLAEEIPPFLYQEKGEIRGIEHEILSDLADSLELDLEVEFVSHEKMISRSGDKKADVLAGAFLQEYSRSSDLPTTESFHREKLARIESEEETKRLGSLSGIDVSNLSVKKAGDISSFPSLKSLVRAYNKNEIGGFIADSARITEALRKISSPLKSESQITEIGEVEYCFAVASDEEGLKKKLDSLLKEFKRSEKLEGLISKYIRGRG